MNSAAAGRMAACQLRMARTVNRLRHDDGPLLSLAMMPQHRALLRPTSLLLQQQRRPQIDWLTARLHTSIVPASGRYARLDRTIPIATAADAV